MSLLHRIARLFKADIHGILDAIEEPDIMLKQAIREMNEEIETAEVNIKALSKELDMASLSIQEYSFALDELEDQIDLCFAENNESLAKSLVGKKLETGHNLKKVEVRRKALLDDRKTWEQELFERKNKLKTICDKLSQLGRQKFTGRAYESESLAKTVSSNSINPEDVELAFLREKQKRFRQPHHQEQGQ